VADSNKDKDKAAAEARQAAEDKSRAEREAAAAAIPSTTPPLVGASQEMTEGADAPRGVLAEAAQNMIVEAARSESGRDYNPPANEEELRNDEARENAERRRGRIEGDPILALGRAIADTQAGDGLTIHDLNPPAPGATERGWSPEVTARHPLVQAEVMAELAGTAGGGGSRRAASREKMAGIDPTDRVALEDALRDQGFHEVRKQDLRNAATRIASDRLAAAQAGAALASPHTRLAMREAVEEAQEVARNIGHDIG
jgi:hypothetical protein